MRKNNEQESGTTDLQEMVSWKKSMLVENLSNVELQQLEKHLISKTYEKGRYLIREGEYGDAIFFIEKGKIAISKDGIQLSELRAGKHVGAMALMENTTRSADVLATETTQVKVLTINQLKAIESDELYQKVLKNQLRAQQKLVRKLTDTTIRETKAKLRESETRVQMANFFFFLILTLVIYQFVLGAYIDHHEFLRQGFYRGIITPSFIITVVALSVFMAKRSGIPLSFLGWKFENWKADLRQSLIWTAGFIGFGIILKWLLIQVVPSYEGRTVFESISMDNSMTPALLILFNLIYAIMTPLQEFVIRGILQGSLSRVLLGKYVAFKSILLSNLIFSALHLHIDLRFALITIIPGFFWGYMYEEQKSILGVSISHVIIGLFFFLIIGDL